MLDTDYEDRPSAEEILKNPWFKNTKKEGLNEVFNLNFNINF